MGRTRSIISQKGISNLFAEPWNENYQVEPISSRMTESCGFACSTTTIATILETGLGCTLGLYSLNILGKNIPMVKLKGHSKPIMDQAFSPFYQQLLATMSEDGLVKLWDIPDIVENLTVQEPVCTLDGHTKKVLFGEFNPTADWILCTASLDKTFKVWDLEHRKCALNTTLAECPVSLKWNFNGSLLATVLRDKSLQIIDPRGSLIISKRIAHDGPKSHKVTWIEGSGGDDNFLLTTGVNKNLCREIRIWDTKNLDTAISSLEVDNGSMPLYPIFDISTGVLVLAAKGDTVFRFYQYHPETKTFKKFIQEFRSNSPSKSFCFVPKLSVDARSCEIMRLLNNEGGTAIQPVSIYVPRKDKERFHEDLYPDVFSTEAATTAQEWLAGVNRNPKTTNSSVLLNVRRPSAFRVNNASNQDGNSEIDRKVNCIPAVDIDANENSNKKRNFIVGEKMTCDKDNCNNYSKDKEIANDFKSYQNCFFDLCRDIYCSSCYTLKNDNFVADEV